MVLVFIVRLVVEGLVGFFLLVDNDSSGIGIGVKFEYVFFFNWMVGGVSGENGLIFCFIGVKELKKNVRMIVIV